MSGGALCDYRQYDINTICESIYSIIENNKKEKSPEDIFKWDYDENGNAYENAKYYYNFSDETIDEFKKGIELLKKAFVYAQRIDWLVSGDDGEESFHRRLKEELDKIYELPEATITFDEYQELMDRRSICPEDMKVVYPALGIAGEAGEVADKVKKICRDHEKNFMPFRRDIGKELGDVLWYISRLAGDLGYKLSDIAKMNVEKVNSRWNTNTVHGQGDNREDFYDMKNDEIR